MCLVSLKQKSYIQVDKHYSVVLVSCFHYRQRTDKKKNFNINSFLDVKRSSTKTMSRIGKDVYIVSSTMFLISEHNERLLANIYFFSNKGICCIQIFNFNVIKNNFP